MTISSTQFLAQTEHSLNKSLQAGNSPFQDVTQLGTADSIGALFSRLASTVFGFLTIVAGLAFLLYFVLGAIQWITSGGDASKVEGARNKMTNAAIGLVAVIAAYTIAGIVSLTLGINILDPTQSLKQIAP